MVLLKERGIAACGLVCALCSDGNCPGCHKCDARLSCGIFQCTAAKGYSACYQCAEFPCGKERYGGIRTVAFMRYVQRYGVESLIERLQTNMEQGILYHYPNGKSRGDYDQLDSVEDIIRLLKYGKAVNPYELCPILETNCFTLRLVREEDWEDLLRCYADPLAQPFFNADNCTNDFRFSTQAQMVEMIRFWLDAYQNHHFVRLTIIDKETRRGVGTVEIFGHQGGFGVLRLDVASAYEAEAYLSDLLSLVREHFFSLFPADLIITKAIPEAGERLKALKDNQFVPYDCQGREHYFAAYPSADN